MAAALIPLVRHEDGKLNAAAMDSGITRQAVLANSAAAFRRSAFAGSARMKIPGEADTM